MRNPSAEPGNSHTNGSSTSGYSRISVSGVSVAGIVCSVSFVQEKGAYSTLRIVYSKVRDGWKYVSVASGENSTLTMNRYRLDRGPRVGPSPSPSPISASSRPSSTFGIPGLGHERVIVLDRLGHLPFASSNHILPSHPLHTITPETPFIIEPVISLLDVAVAFPHVPPAEHDWHHSASVELFH